MKKYKITKLLTLISIVIILIFAGKFYYDKSFKGNSNIRLIVNSEKIKTLESLTQLKELRNNVLYIDIWGTSCGPCFAEFKHTSELKERYKDEQVKFVYLSVPYLHFNDEQKWKNMIQKYNLKGYHSLINLELYDNIMKRKDIAQPYLIPHYILIDRQGNISELNAFRPSSKEKLYKQIDEILHYQPDHISQK